MSWGAQKRVSIEIPSSLSDIVQHCLAAVGHSCKHAQRARKRIQPPFSSNTYNRVAPKLWGNRGSIARQPDRRVGHFGSNEIQSADSQRVEVRDPEQQPPISTLIPRLSEGVEREKKQNAWAWSPFH
jgi:hypothetical protein